MGAELFRQYVISSVMISYRSVMKHPFLVGMGFLLILMYRLFPLLFSLLVSASPVIVSTAVLLGTLLSFGQPNIPEIEIEKESKSDRDEVQKLETRVMDHTEIVGRDVSFASVETNGSRSESFREKTDVNDDLNDPSVGLIDDNGFITEEKCENMEFKEEDLIEEGKNEMGDDGIDVDEEKDVLGSHYTPLQQSESDDKLWEGSADPLNSDSGLLWKRMEGDDSEDDEGSDSGSDLAESSSPDASMADIIPMLDELHPLLGEEPETHQPAHIPEHSIESSDSSGESNDDDGGEIENHQDLEVGDDDEDEDKESKHADKEDEIRSVITWTEDDQKNLMNLGTSELERNRRLENLIARRRARKTMRMQAEKNLIDLESSDIPWNIPPISTARNNPFDISYDSNDNVPGSAPSVLLQRRNPFDLPYDSSEEKPDLVGDTFQQEFAAIQPKEPFFRRHESFNVGPSIFGASRSERQETKLRPYFVPERIASDGTNFSSFQRQLSELSDSKVTDSESISSAGDLENKGHIEDDLSLEPEPISEKDQEHVSDDVIQVTPYFVPEQVASAFHRQLSELSESKVSSVPDTESISSDENLENKDPIEDDLLQEAELISIIDQEHPSGIREPFELISANDGNVGPVQAEKQDDELDGAEISVDNLETVNAGSSMELISDATHLSLGDRGLHSSASSLSSSYEVSDQIYNEKEDDDDEMPTSVAETDYYFVDRGNLIETSAIDITSLSVEESQPKEPIYDSSPRGVTKNLSSSSISTDLQTDVPNLERTSSVSGRESQETVQKTETDCAINDAEVIDSSERDATEEIESRSVKDNNLIDFQHAEEDQHQESRSSSPETRDAQNQIPAEPDNEEPLSAGDSISTSLLNKPLFETEDAEDPEEMQITFKSEEEAISQLHKELALLDTSADKPSEEYPEVLQIQEPENNISLSTNSVLNPEPNVVEVAGIETKAPETLAYTSDIHSIESKNAPNNVDDVDEIDEIDESLLVELDAVGDFGFKDLGSTSNEMKEDQHASKHDHENKLSADEDSYSNDLGSILNEMKRDPHASEHDLEDNPSVGQDSDSKDLGSTLNEIKQDPCAPELDLEDNLSVDQDSYSKDLGSTLNEMKRDPLGLEHDLEDNPSVDQDSYSKDLGSTSNEMKRDLHGSEHDLEDNPSVDQDSYSKDQGSTLNEMKQDPHGLEHDLEDSPSVDQDSYSKHLGSTLNEMKRDPHGLEDDLETNSYSKDLGSTLNEMKEESNDLETNSTVDLGSISNEMIQDPHVLEHDLQTNRSVDEDSYIEDLKSGLNEMKQEPRALGAHTLETFYSVDENAFIKDIESTLNEMKQDPQTLEHDHSTDFSETKTEMDAEERTKPNDEKKISNTEVAGASEASSGATVDHGRENVLSTDNKE